ncbi:TolB family protein [Gemmatimonadota bacterium]
MIRMINRREFLPLAGAGAVLAPTIVAGCATSTEPDPLSIPGTIAFQRVTSSRSDIYIMDWSADNQINLTADIPGSSSAPFWSPDGSAIFFDRIVDGNRFIARIDDLTNPSESLATVVDLEGDQLWPIVHSEGELLVYHHLETPGSTAGYLAAYDMNSSSVISMTENVVGNAGDNERGRSEDKQFLPGDRKVVFTGYAPKVGIFDPDTGEVVNPYEAYGTETGLYQVNTNSVCIPSVGSRCFGTGMTPSGGHDIIVSWELMGNGTTTSLHRHVQRMTKTREMGDIIQFNDNYIMLVSFKPGHVTSSTLSTIAFINIGHGEKNNVRISTARFQNMEGNNYWPRHTFTEHF